MSKTTVVAFPVGILSRGLEPPITPQRKHSTKTQLRRTILCDLFQLGVDKKGLFREKWNFYYYPDYLNDHDVTLAWV